MQVVDLLAAVRIAIDDQSIAAICDSLLPGEVARHGEHMADQRFVLVGNVVGGMGLFGTISMCTGAATLMSGNDPGVPVTTWRYSPAMIFQQASRCLL